MGGEDLLFEDDGLDIERLESLREDLQNIAAAHSVYNSSYPSRRKDTPGIASVGGSSGSSFAHAYDYGNVDIDLQGGPEMEFDIFNDDLGLNNLNELPAGKAKSGQLELPRMNLEEAFQDPLDLAPLSPQPEVKSPNEDELPDSIFDESFTPEPPVPSRKRRRHQGAVLDDVVELTNEHIRRQLQNTTALRVSRPSPKPRADSKLAFTKNLSLPFLSDLMPKDLIQRFQDNLPKRRKIPEEKEEHGREDTDGLGQPALELELEPGPLEDLSPGFGGAPIAEDIIDGSGADSDRWSGIPAGGSESDVEFARGIGSQAFGPSGKSDRSSVSGKRSKKRQRTFLGVTLSGSESQSQSRIHLDYGFEQYLDPTPEGGGDFQIPEEDVDEVEERKLKAMKQRPKRESKMTGVFRNVLSKAFHDLPQEQNAVKFKKFLENVMPNPSRMEVARGFLQLLVLRANNEIDVVQRDSYGNIFMSKGENWLVEA
ncbi:hypothetical protein AAMO2058_000650500 [Amorphochlora amoebiformis]